LTKDNTFTPQSIDAIKASAFGILERVGMRVAEPSLSSKLDGDGFRTVDGRIRISPTHAAEFLARLITEAQAQAAPATCPRRLDVWVNNYPHSYRCPATNTLVPYDCASLVRMTSFVNRLARRHSFTPSEPGFPRDVPHSCAAVARYVIGSKYLDSGTTPEPMCRHSARHLFAMADALGKPIRGLPLYVATPLTIGDESFRVMMENARRIDAVWVGSMPSFGASTPLSVSGALALNLAETLGAAMIAQRLTGLQAHIWLSLYPFDFKDLNLAFGTPETLMLNLVCRDFTDALFGTTSHGGGVEIHSNSIFPDAQTAAEKALAMTAAYMKMRTGTSAFQIIFRGMGTIGMDEIFSPAQFILDIELLNYMRRLDTPYEIDALPDSFIDEIRDGVLGSGFTGSDRTARDHRRMMYHSPLFTRANPRTQLRDNTPTAETRAAALALDELRHPPELVLDPQLAATLDRMLADAINTAT